MRMMKTSFKRMISLIRWNQSTRSSLLFILMGMLNFVMVRIWIKILILIWGNLLCYKSYSIWQLPIVILIITQLLINALKTVLGSLKRSPKFISEKLRHSFPIKLILLKKPMRLKNVCQKPYSWKELKRSSNQTRTSLKW